MSVENAENEVRRNHAGHPIHTLMDRTILATLLIDVLGTWLFFAKEVHYIALPFYALSVFYPFSAIWTWWHQRPLARNFAFLWLGTLPVSIIFFFVMKGNSDCHMIQSVCAQ